MIGSKLHDCDSLAKLSTQQICVCSLVYLKIITKKNIVIVHQGQYWRFYFPCFFGTRGGRSPTPSAKRTGRKTNNIARGAHIAYCAEGKTRVFQRLAMKSCQKTKKWRNVHPVFFPPSGKKKCACFFFPRFGVYFPSQVGK